MEEGLEGCNSTDVGLDADNCNPPRRHLPRLVYYEDTVMGSSKMDVERWIDEREESDVSLLDCCLPILKDTTTLTETAKWLPL